MRRRKNIITVAIDSPAAAGAGTQAKYIAQNYNLSYLDTGKIYRYLGNLAIKRKSLDYHFFKKKINQLNLNKLKGKKLLSDEVAKSASIIAKNKKIRDIVNFMQRKIISSNKKICVEGRDIASKILVKNPKYDLAFYFKCNLNEASKRRWYDLKKSIPLKEIKKSLKTRTMMDKKRKNSPLIKVKDAILIRTDKLNKKQVLSKMSEHIEKLN